MGRQRRLKNMDERFEAYASAIELEADEKRGCWAHELLPEAAHVYLDLGCGRGSFTTEQARRNPDCFYVGMDNTAESVVLAAQRALEARVFNVCFALADAFDVADWFAAGELSGIYLNFSTPFPASKHAKKRLTHIDRLMSYHDLLEEGGFIEFKTDSEPLRLFSLTQFELTGYIDDTDNFSSADVSSEYERSLVENGAPVLCGRFLKGEKPASCTQTAETSLVKYLPEDVESLEYRPRGMETAIENIILCRKKNERRAAWAARQAAREAQRNVKD